MNIALTRSIELFGMFKKKEESKREISSKEFEALCLNIGKIIPQVLAISHNIHKSNLTKVYEKIFDPKSLQKFNYPINEFIKERPLGRTVNKEGFIKRLTKVTSYDYDQEKDKVYEKYYDPRNKKPFKPIAVIIEAVPSEDFGNKAMNSLWWVRDENGKIVNRDSRFIAIREVLSKDNRYDFVEFEKGSGTGIHEFYNSALFYDIFEKITNTMNAKYNKDFKDYGEFKTYYASSGGADEIFFGFVPNFKVSGE